MCSEKADEWKRKLGRIGLKIVEFTGDTASDKGFLHETKNADVIITTVGFLLSSIGVILTIALVAGEMGCGHPSNVAKTKNSRATSFDDAG